MSESNKKQKIKLGLHEPQLPVEKSVTSVSFIVVERRRCALQVSSRSTKAWFTEPPLQVDSLVVALSQQRRATTRESTCSCGSVNQALVERLLTWSAQRRRSTTLKETDVTLFSTGS